MDVMHDVVAVMVRMSLMVAAMMFTFTRAKPHRHLHE
jgi:hypothetical protein